MGQYLFQYTPVAPTTWAYLASLLIIGLFFKFNGFWRVRNLDLVLLVLLAPGLLLEHFGSQMEKEAGTVSAAADPVGPSGLPAFGLPPDTPPTRASSDSALDATPGEGDATEPSSVAVRANEDAPKSPANDDSDAANEDQNRVATIASAELAVTEQVQAGRNLRFVGFIWLFSVSAVILFRTLLDPRMVRRPLLEPNLSTGGLTFIGCSLFVFLTANVIAGNTTDDDLRGPRSADKLLRAESTPVAELSQDERGPGNAFLHLLPAIVTKPFQRGDEQTPPDVTHEATAKTMAILCHLAVVIGMVAIGYRHFANIKMGIGAASLYLMLPYTAQMTGRVTHVVPAALLIWAILFYRRPLTAGLLIGTAIGVMYYPMYLLPLWLSFYWQKGLARFLTGVVGMLVFWAVLLLVVSADSQEYLYNLRGMLGIWWPKMEGLGGIWGLGWSPVFRIPVLSTFAVLSFSFIVWPARKNLGTLLSCSTAVMVATQFWHGYGGGLYMGWYLPTLILTIFRPNLEDRIALTVLGEGWRGRPNVNKADRAA